MPFIQLNDKQFPLRMGDVRIGTGADADIRLPGPDGPEAQAVIGLAADGSAVVRRGSDVAVVRVNGVQLGVEPSPLIHGDKIDVYGTELTFGDDKKGGSTQYISAMNVPQMASGPAKVNKPTAATGGRLVSLVDGREYQITGSGLMIGRDPSCDVVVPSTEVSRRHAEIVVRADGYVVNDMSTNGVFVNGERVQQSRVLGRADVIKIANEELRFYADAAAVAPAAGPRADMPGAAGADLLPNIDFEPLPAPTPHGAGSTAVIAPPQRPASPQAPRPHPGSPASGMAPQGAPPGPATGPLLGTLEIVNEGVNKGRRFEIRRPLVHVGRGAHNDVQVVDDSVSDVHAKIQKRDAGWFVVDMDSTNGTYVGGKRIVGEAALVGAPDVRFGGIKMRFSALAEGEHEGKGTRAIAGITLDQAKKLAESRGSASTPPSIAAQPAAPTPVSAPVAASDAEARGGIPAIAWLVLAVVVAAAAYFILGR